MHQRRMSLLEMEQRVPDERAIGEQPQVAPLSDGLEHALERCIERVLRHDRQFRVELLVLPAQQVGFEVGAGKGHGIILTRARRRLLT